MQEIKYPNKENGLHPEQALLRKKGTLVVNHNEQKHYRSKKTAKSEQKP